MFVYPYVTLNTDVAYWIAIDELISSFDLDDLINNREQKIVCNIYLNSWLYKTNNKLKLILPTVTYYDGKTHFINGRHRLCVLAKEMDILPIAFSKGATDFVAKFSFNKVDMKKSFSIPNYNIE